MAKYTINSIGGISQTYFSEGYLGSCAIDPDEKINGRIAGAISPVGYVEVSGSAENVLWLTPNDYNTDVYYYTAGGRFGKVDTSYDTTELYTFDNSKGNGLTYYNNYYYIAVNTDIHRYGPISSPSLQEYWWTGLIDTEEAGKYEINVTADVARPSADAYSQVIQNLRTRFDTISVDLKDTGTTSYDVKLTIQNIEPTSYLIDDGVNFSVDIHNPSGAILASATLNSSGLSSAFSTQAFTLNKALYTTDDFAVTLEVETSGAGKSFTVRESDGSVKEGTYLIDKRTTWKKDIVYDNSTSAYTVTSKSYTKAYEYTISTDQTKLTEDLTMEFEIYNPGENAIYEGCYIRLNGNDITDSSNWTSNKPTYWAETLVWASASKFTNIKTKYLVKLHPSLNLKNGDVLSFWMFGENASSGAAPIGIKNITSGSYIYPYFRFEEASDTKISISTDSLAFLSLGDKTYPTIGGYEIPNHTMHFHNDGAVYFCDTQRGGAIGKINMADRLSVIDIEDDGVPDGSFSIGDLVRGETSNAMASVIKIDTISTATDEQGLVLFGIVGTFIDGENIFAEATTIIGVVSGTVQSGIANLNSESLALDLPLKYNPVAMTSLGTDLMIAANSTDGNSALFLWDTYADSFYREIKLPFQKTTALFSHNGTPYIWGGDDSGYSLYAYSGGETVEPITYIDNGYMPLQGSIDANGNKILWGSSQTYPETRGCVWAWGSKALSPALHNIASTTSQISSMRVNDLDSKLMLCDSTDIYQKGTTYDSIWRSEILSFGKPFEVSEVIIPLSRKLVADEVIKVKFLYDNETHESDEYEITLDDYPEMFIKLYPPQQGVSNMIIEITIECGVSILFPIQIEYDFRE